MFGTSAVFYRKPNRFRIDHRDGKPLPSGNSKFRLIRSKSTVSTNRSSPSKQVAQVPITPVKNIPYAWVSRQYAADRISAKNDQNESVKLTGKRHSSTRRYKLVRSANISGESCANSSYNFHFLVFPI